MESTWANKESRFHYWEHAWNLFKYLLSNPQSNPSCWIPSTRDLLRVGFNVTGKRALRGERLGQGMSSSLHGLEALGTLELGGSLLSAVIAFTAPGVGCHALLSKPEFWTSMLVLIRKRFGSCMHSLHWMLNFLVEVVSLSSLPDYRRRLICSPRSLWGWMLNMTVMVVHGILPVAWWGQTVPSGPYGLSLLWRPPLAWLGEEILCARAPQELVPHHFCHEFPSSPFVSNKEQHVEGCTRTFSHVIERLRAQGEGWVHFTEAHNQIRMKWGTDWASTHLYLAPLLPDSPLFVLKPGKRPSVEQCKRVLSELRGCSQAEAAVAHQSWHVALAAFGLEILGITLVTYHHHFRSVSNGVWIRPPFVRGCKAVVKTFLLTFGSKSPWAREWISHEFASATTHPKWASSAEARSSKSFLWWQQFGGSAEGLEV